MKRRTFIGTAAAAAIGIPAYRYARAYFEPLPDFEAIDDPVGFRRIAGGLYSASSNPWVGLDGPVAKPAPLITESEVRDNICGALYGQFETNSDVVPIASFSDYNCPYCRILTKRLSELSAELGPRLRIEWHELPLLGDASLLSARAALAAKRQGAYVQFSERLMTTAFQTTPEYLVALSDSIGVDQARLISDMNGQGVQLEIDQTAALARIFGFIGTPAMVIGRTVIQGLISESSMRKIIELERKEGWTQVC